MNDRWLLSSFGASLGIHVILLPIASLLIEVRRSGPIAMPIDLVEVPRVGELKEADTGPQVSETKSLEKRITAPKLLSKPALLESPPFSLPGNMKKEAKKPEKPAEGLPPIASRPSKPGTVKDGSEGEEGAAGTSSLFGKGDVGVVEGSALEGSDGGQGGSGLSTRSKGEGAGGGAVSGEALSSFAHPLGGYQVKPRYPESARREKAHGITLLKLRVLENGKVGEVHIEKSAGHADLDNAAVNAVKQWLFEPARMGRTPVAVWVLLPVHFELQ